MRESLFEIFEYDLITFCLAILYLTLFCFLFLIIIGNSKRTTLTILVSLLLFFIPFVLFLFNQIIKVKGIPPDSSIYASIIMDYGNNYNNYSFGVMGYSIINYVPFFLSWQSPGLYITFNIFFFNLAALFIYKAFEVYLLRKEKVLSTNHFTFFLFLILFYPAGFLHSASILRESSLLLYFSISVWILAKLYSQNLNRTYWIFLVITIMLTTVIRPITGIILVLFFFLIIGSKNGYFELKKILRFVPFMLIILWLCKELILTFYDLDFSINWLHKFREDHALDYGKEGYNVKSWDDFLSLLINPILLFIQYLFSPLPILVNKEITFNKLLPLLDATFIILLLIPILINKNKKTIKHWLFGFILVILISSLFETNISGAYRHRMNGIFLLLPMSVYYMFNLKITFFEKG